MDAAIEAKEVSEPLKACNKTCNKKCSLRFSTCLVCVTTPRVGSRDAPKTSFPSLRNTIQQRAIEVALPHSENELDIVSQHLMDLRGLSFCSEISLSQGSRPSITS